MHRKKLVAIQTHPIQYWAPLYKMLNRDMGIDIKVVYGSDFSCKGYFDSQFGANFAWDFDLTDGYESHFLSTIAESPECNTISRLKIKNLSEIITRYSPDVILLTGYSPRFNLISALTAVKSGIPLIIRCEATDTSHYRNKIKGLIRDLFLKYLYSKVSAFCFTGSSSRNHYLRLGIPEKSLFFSPYCVPAEPISQNQKTAWRNEIRKKLNIPDTRLVILFSGKLIRKKSPDHLLLSSAYLPKNTLRNTSVIFTGDGNLIPVMKQMPENRRFASVHYVGFINQSQIQMYYAAADLLCLSSLFSETWGLVVNEALTVGIPCVVSDRVGCHFDLIQSGVTGETHRADDIKDLAEKLEITIKLSQKHETFNNCQNKIKQYSMRQAALGIQEAVNSICNL